MFDKKKIALCSATLLSVLSGNIDAANTPYIVIAPLCLIQQLNTPYQTLATKNNLSLIQIGASGIDHLIAAKQQQKTVCGGFIDVTSSWKEFHANSLSLNDKAVPFLAHYAAPAYTIKKANYHVQYQNEVKQLMSQLNPQQMWNDLTTLSSFPDRYARSENGVKAAEWFKAQIESIIGDRKDISISLIKTGSYQQPSVVVKLGDVAGPGIVIGAHMDTTSGNKPGADDDGSGSVTVLQAARTIIASGMHFKKPIYFIWYAAEEAGLVGSEYVVKEFKKKKIPVSEVIQFDMTGYAHKNDPTIWLIDDYVNSDLNAFLETLIHTYVKKTVAHTECGYACSDHASWTQAGHSAVMPAEAAFENTNPVLHTSSDTIEKLSLEHMSDYAKLAAAFAVELAGPQ